MSDEKKQYPKPPAHIKVLKNGAGYDMEKKKIADAPGTYAPAPYNITSENAAEMAKIGRERTKARIQAAIVEQARARNLNVSSPPDAVGHAAGVLFGEVLDKKGTLRDRNKVLWDVAKHAELIKSQENANNSQTNIQINLDASVLRDILSATGGQIIDIEPE